MCDIYFNTHQGFTKKHLEDAAIKKILEELNGTEQRAVEVITGLSGEEIRHIGGLIPQHSEVDTE